ncbi:uncharacterized protein [Asterias amurensis]|uniref:uncharacterized protein n=1 Tax=Asterias amurensis TaxID=7602 RepID=UPI003AB33444
MRPRSSRLRQVAIGNQLERWDAMKTRLGLESHAQLAEVLLDGMEATVEGDVVWGSKCNDPKLKSKLASFFKRKGIAALVIQRARKAATPKPSQRRKKMPVKIKIKIMKKEPKTVKPKGENGQGGQDAEIVSHGEEDEEGEIIDDFEDQDFSPHEPSRHGLKKAWLGRHLKGKKKSLRQRKRSLPKPETDEELEELEAAAMEDEEEEEEETIKEEKNAKGLRRKLRQTSARKKRMKHFKIKQRRVRSATKTVEELFGPDAVLAQVYCCRKCTSQLDSADVMKAHWQTHLAEEEDTTAVKAAQDGSPEGTSQRGEEGDETKPVGVEAEDGGDGDPEVPEDVKRIARVLTRCPLCQKLFSNILAHTACHSNYLCEECGIMFRQRRSLKLHHRAVHELGETGQLPFVCSRCGRAFRWEASLRKHRTLHSQHRQFICQTCGKSFKVQAHLKRHVIMHEEVKPFVCPHCGRRFTELSNMKVHTRVHTGEKPYICDVCQKAYAHKVSLKTHKKKEHGIDMWQLGYITQPVIEFDDDGKETEYSIARRSRRPSIFNSSGKSRKRKHLDEKVTPPPLDVPMKAEQVSKFVREKNQERHPRLNDSVEDVNNEPPTVPAQQAPQLYAEPKMQTPIQQQHNTYQQHAQIQALNQPQPEVHPQQHMHPQQQQQQHHMQMHNQSYGHSHPSESSQQVMDDDADSEPCSAEEEENPRLLHAELITNQMRHAQRLQMPETNNHPSQPLPLQLPQSQSIQHQQQQQVPPHTQTQPLPHLQIPSMRQHPPQAHQANQRPPLPSFESVTSTDRQGHSQYRQSMMNTMAGLDINALVAGTMPYMYWGSQQYQGAPSYIQRNNEDTTMETPKQ